MVVGIVIAELFFHGNGSLKGKRHHIKSIKDRLRNNFNVSVSEIDHHDLWQRSAIAVAVVGSDGKYVTENLSKIMKFIEKNWPEYVVEFKTKLV